MRSSLVLAILIVALIGEVSALVVYRFGGDPEDLPAEKIENPDEVEFIQIPWAAPVDEDLGGVAFQIDDSDGTLRALEHHPDDNIAPTAEERGQEGGVRKGTRQVDQKKAIDGDLSTAWFPEEYLCAECGADLAACDCGTDDYAGIAPWTIGLGGFFNVDRVRIKSGLSDESKIMKTFRIFGASGRQAGTQYGVATMKQVFNQLVDIRENKRQILDVQIPPTDRLDFLMIQYAEHSQEWEVAEIEIYAKGFVEQTSYVSEIISFPQGFAWGELSWRGTQGAGAEVRIHTRSGNSPEQNVYWRNTGRGNKVALLGEDTAKQYKRLSLGERGGTTYNRDEWTFWSAPYDFADSSGTPVVSSGPRPYFQFKVDIVPSSNAGGEIQYLEFRASEPLASGLIGEVFPTQAQIADNTTFTYYLEPKVLSGATGFDGLEMRTSSVINEVTALRIGEEERNWVELQPGDVVPLDVRGQPTASFPANGFQLEFPDLPDFPDGMYDQGDSRTLIEVDFDARVLRSGSTFEVRVLDSTQPLAVRQSVDAGDANSLIESNTISVVTTAGADALLQATVSKVVTPNGDNVNDVATISYDLMEIIGVSPVTVEVLDLSGRLVAEVYSGNDVVGHYDREWHGVDNGGKRVPPGAYLYRIKVDTDRPDPVMHVGVVTVAY